VSWQFKKFADASSKPWFVKAWRNKIAFGFTNSAALNGDKFSTIQYMITLSQQHGMLWAGTGMMPSNAKASTRSDPNNLGGYSGLLTASPSDASPDEMIPGDIATAKLFGQRIVEVVTQFIK
jgi:NAD(P)H dehydrogenase (quinone)